MNITKDMVLKTLEDAGKPILDVDLYSGFNLDKTDGPAFLELLDSLELEGKVIKTKKGKYALPILMNLVLGKLVTTQKGFGFVIAENMDTKDIFIPASELNGGMNGDLVYCKITGSESEGKRKEGVIVKIIRHANEQIVGTFDSNETFGFVIPDDKKLSMDIYIPYRGFGGAKKGQKVVVKITKWPEGRRNPEGVVTEVLGFITDKGVDVLSVIKKFQLPEEFPRKVQRSAERVPEEVELEAMEGRRDLRGETIVTIDGADAKDLDDAVHVKKLENGNYVLGVHIADVTHYVNEGSKLDVEALKRGTSVYLIDRVIPMLPRTLSNGICSLNPKVNRLTLSCEMEISPQGKVVKQEIYESVIKTTERMTYTDVSDILENVDRPELKQYEELVPTFNHMQDLCKILRQRRETRGAIDFDFPEPRIILDEEGTPIEIVQRERRIANRIIEEFMLIANETVAEYIFWLEYPFVYRIHEDPDPERIVTFNKFLHNFGYELKMQEDELHPKTVQQLLESVQGKKEEHIINKLMLRSLKQARYSPVNEGHFGLAAEYYCHFTSPIRRYPDLQIHRIIKEAIKGKLTAQRISQLIPIVDYAAKQSSERERVAEQAERETDDMKKAEFMLPFIGHTFNGIISSVTSFGIFTELDNTIEGLTRVSMLEDDYYLYDEENMRMIGERTKKTYSIGDPVEVRVDKVDVGLREIDFYILRKLD
ncbi:MULTISPECIES: ribonuclease R [unclassified Fusibacter]|uniref:ribonuclease R n=1 Tax=unclassified Fusibacter TaxID=2624464 RepID=UPI001012794D|nr:MULTISPECIES: ribonuclease R [unclassified Fusibacter]MCK8059736.1 ribonuclease R [Fusibacter sp. A2]NPE21537.1 ribonuclease R [Fusibacter sp. A1]RXV61946.1 ribonuclease R [Fusibacter sp. A1]